MAGERSPDPRRHDRMLGVALRLSAILLVAGLSAVVKWIGVAIPAGEVVFVRGATAVVVLLVIARRMQRPTELSVRKCFLYAPRTIFTALSMYVWFAALTRAPLANLNAIGYTLPIFSTLFAVFIGEHVALLQWGGVAAGFAGVLIMVGPHVALADASLLGMLLALAASMSAALVNIFTRQLNRTEDRSRSLSISLCRPRLLRHSPRWGAG